MNEILKYSDDKLKDFGKRVYKEYTQPRFKWVIEVNKWHEFYKGNHFNYAQAYYARPTNIGVISRVVNYSGVLIENKRNQILSNEPVPVIPRSLTVNDGQDPNMVAVTYEQVIDRVYDENHLNILSDDVVLNGCIDNSSFVQVNTDETKKSGISLDLLDWRQVIMFPGIKDITKSPLLGKQFTAIIGDILANPHYITKNVQKLVARDKYKEKNNSDEPTPEKEVVSTQVNSFDAFDGVEWQTPIYIDDETKEYLASLKVNGQTPYEWVKNKKNGERIMRIFTIAQDMVIRDEYIDVDRYNIFCYTPQSGNIYGMSILARLISANKSYDSLISQIELFMAYANKFRILIPQNTKLNDDWDNINGQQIRFDGQPPVTPPQATLSPAVMQYVMKLEATMQFLVNFHASSMGEMASGSKKAQAMKISQGADLSNSYPAIRRYNAFLEDITKFILYLRSSNMQMEEFSYMYANKRTDTTIIGSAYKKHIMKNIDPNTVPTDFVNKVKGAIEIKPDTDVKVKIAPGLNYNDEALASKVIELVKSGDLPNQALELVFDDGKMIPLFEIAKQEAAKKAQEELQQQEQQQQSQNQQEQTKQSQASNQKLLVEILKHPEIIDTLRGLGANVGEMMQAATPQQPQQPQQMPPQGQMPQEGQQMPPQGGMSSDMINELVNKKAPFKHPRKTRLKNKK